MLYAGLDLSRQRLDVRILDHAGRTVELSAVRPDADALRSLVERVARYGEPVEAAIESMNGTPSCGEIGTPISVSYAQDEMTWPKQQERARVPCLDPWGCAWRARGHASPARGSRSAGGWNLRRRSDYAPVLRGISAVGPPEGGRRVTTTRVTSPRTRQLARYVSRFVDGSACDALR